MAHEILGESDAAMKKQVDDTQTRLAASPKEKEGLSYPSESEPEPTKLDFVPVKATGSFPVLFN